MADRRDFFEKLVYNSLGGRRFTQESPVMPDVWIHYGLEPGRQQKLLMVPNWHHTTADLASALRFRLDANGGEARLSRYRSSSDSLPTMVAHNQNVLAATLWFDELVTDVLPLSSWWRQSIAQIEDRRDESVLVELLRNPAAFVDALVASWDGVREGGRGATADIVWLARVAGLIAWTATEEARNALSDAGSEEQQVKLLGDMLRNGPRTLAETFVDVLGGVRPVYADDDFPLYTVNRNRLAPTSLFDSVQSVKADACGRLFQVSGRGIRWAVIDSGIDATHTAFRVRASDGTPLLQPFGRPRRRRRNVADSVFSNNTRVVSTYDFQHIRELLGARPDDVNRLRQWFPILDDEKRREDLRELLDDLRSLVVDWERLEPFLRVPHTPAGYRAPLNRHGTHVAGIIGADWRTSDTEVGLHGPRQDMFGVCPGIELIDLRVLGDDGSGDEFAIMSAMQFIRDLNSRRDFVAVHGVNLSLSIPHDVANYACGRTPVCEEAERLVGSGLFVVAAAGNSGRARYLTPSNEIDDGFRTVSITDPGNAENVITVGSTHRRDPHTYGVSYFSSRGPTGDGRLKPDLVAPGEKIRSTVPGDGDDRLDGTSMAAPHVSGAAALIMARHPELIGQPRRIKQILCGAATDLGRERYFQGAGLLDILRALQTI